MQWLCLGHGFDWHSLIGYWHWSPAKPESHVRHSSGHISILASHPMGKHTEWCFSADQRNKRHDSDSDCSDNEQESFSDHIPDLIRRVRRKLDEGGTVPVKGRQSKILNSGQYSSALLVDVHVRCSKRDHHQDGQFLGMCLLTACFDIQRAFARRHFKAGVRQ